MKDLFIDNCIALKFANPIEESYKELIRWLIENKESYLVVSPPLLREYFDSNQNCSIASSIPVIIDRLTKENRLNRVSNSEIKEFQRINFTKQVVKKLRSNKKDHQHIPVVLLSQRKIALTTDINLAHDLVNFKKYTCIVSDDPAKIEYKN